MTLTNSIQSQSLASVPPFLHHGCGADAYLRTIDLLRDPFGPPEHWPATLPSMTSLVLRFRQPMLLAWGPDHQMIYNEGYAEIFGDRHLAAEGENFFDVWSEIRGVFEPLARRVYAGKSVYVDNVEEQQNRNG